jgi:hypothetical protein
MMGWPPGYCACWYHSRTPTALPHVRRLEVRFQPYSNLQLDSSSWWYPASRLDYTFHHALCKSFITPGHSAVLVTLLVLHHKNEQARQLLPNFQQEHFTWGCMTVFALDTALRTGLCVQTALSGAVDLQARAAHTTAATPECCKSIAF